MPAAEIDNHILTLPRVCARGSAPRIVVPNSILDMIPDKNRLSDYEIARNLLEELYNNRKLSISKISEIFGVQGQTVQRWMTRLEVQIRPRVDTVSISLTKYHKHDFSGDPREKAYLIGLRTGDIAVQKHGKSFRASITTSHPAMLALFCKCFGKYNRVGLYPKKSKLTGGYNWSLFSDLGESFLFLKEKPNSIPKWILENRELFLDYLAGYFDSEGCVSISYRKNNGIALSFILKSCDKLVLSNIVDSLRGLGFELNFRLAKQADHKSYSQDYWIAILSQKQQALKLLDILPLRHQEKILKRKLAYKISNDTRFCNSELKKYRKLIECEVHRCRKFAAIEAAKKSNGIGNFKKFLENYDVESELIR